MNNVLIILLIGVGIILFFVIKHKIKNLKVPNVFLVTGGVKSGKTALSLHLAIKKYRSNLLLWYITWPFVALKVAYLKYVKHDESACIPLKPMFYSSIPVRNIRFNKFTKDILFRKVRIPNKSVVFIDEVTLLADSFLYKDKKINDCLMIFIKLFAHYTHGGSLIINTQAFSDLHFAFKRCISNYLFIHNSTKFPFITISKVREMIKVDEVDNTNVFNSDVEDSMKTLFFFNSTYKKYDCYCYSIFTDDNPYHVDYNTAILKKHDSLKCDELVTLQEFTNLLYVNKDSLESIKEGIEDE